MSNVLSSEPKLITVYRLANDLLREYGLIEKGWSFDLAGSKQRVGQCRYSDKVITYSKHFIDPTPLDDIRNTILHEIAHALIGPDHGHDQTWMRMAIAVGARPQRCAAPTTKSTAKYNFVIKCQVCDAKWYRFRVKRQVYTATHCGAVVKVFRLKHS